MQKTYSVFKKYIPIILLTSSLSLIFGMLTFLYYFDEPTMTINIKNVIPIFTIMLIVIAFSFVCIFTGKVKRFTLTKLKKTFGFSKFAALLAATLAAASFFFDFFRFVDQPATFSAFRIIRLLIFIPFIAYFIINVIPKKIKRKKIILPVWLKPFAAIGTLIWCVLGLVMIYFWSAPVTDPELSTINIFKLAFIFQYILVTLFFAFEIKFELLSPVPKAYIFFAGTLFVYSFTIIGSIMLTTIWSDSNNLSGISLFEIFLAFALGLYALSKLIAMQRTMKFVMSKHSGETVRHHHHHSSKSADNTKDDSKSNDTAKQNSKSKSNKK